jgi:hypothetical protein
MLFFASGQGRLTVVPAQINQNSNGANTIYLTGAFPSASVVTVAFTLPDGTNTEPQLMTGDKTVDYNGLTLAVKEYSLPKSITQVYGRVTAQFYIQNGSEILATEATNITVAKGVPSESPSAPENIYEQIVAALSSIQAELDNPKRETYIGTSVPTDGYPDLFVNTTDDSLSYKAPDGSWKPIAGGGLVGGGLVDDVLINGVSIVVDKTANIPVDLGTDADSSNPIANKVVVKALNDLSTDITEHKNNKQNPHSVTAAQIGLGNVTTELATVERNLSAHEKNTDNPHNVTAAQIGLGNVDNTSDADKPVSTKQAAAIKVVQDEVTAHKNNIKNPHMVTAAQVGLGNVNNTSDANKPVSTAQQTALDKKIDKAGGTFSGNVAIQGDLTVSGTTTTESETQLAVKENVIVTNADKANLQTLLSGLAINKNSTATYGIMYDPADDTVKFGEGTLDANRKFVFKAGEGHPLAIRADSSQFTDAVLVKWNATTKAFEPAGGTWQDLLNKIEITDIDLTLGDETVLYDTTNGIQLSATGKITRKDGTSEQPQVDLDIPIVPGNGIKIDKVANKEQVAVKVDTDVVAVKSDLTLYAKTSDLNSYVKTTTLNTTLADYAKTTDLAAYAKTVDVVEKSQVGAASGVASLGTDGKVPAAQLPTIDNYSKFSEIDLQNSNVVPTYSATKGVTVTSTGSMKHANNVVDTPTNTMVVPITAGKNMSATLGGTHVVFAANDQVGVGATLPAGSDSEKIFINTAGNTARVYYNDNGTWKVVDVQGGGSGSIDADTLNGLLSAGDGISIGKTTAGDKVEVKINPFANIVGATFEARDDPTRPIEYMKLRWNGIFEYHSPIFNYTFSLPAAGDSGMYQLLASNYVKTLFGNQSIVGAGNIDLYRHHILCSTPNEGIKVLITVISGKNLKVDSLTDLKTLLGNTFECPCTGYAMEQGQSLDICNENGFLPIDIWINIVDPMPDITWSNIESIVDTVTTI